MVRLKCHSQYELRHMLEITLVQKFQDHFQQCIQLPTPFQFSIPKSQKCFHSCVWMNVGAKTLRHASNLRFKNKKAGWLFQEPEDLFSGQHSLPSAFTGSSLHVGFGWILGISWLHTRSYTHIPVHTFSCYRKLVVLILTLKPLAPC